MEDVFEGNEGEEEDSDEGRGYTLGPLGEMFPDSSSSEEIIIVDG
jgi:hypothetical protein